MSEEKRVAAPSGRPDAEPGDAAAPDGTAGGGHVGVHRRRATQDVEPPEALAPEKTASFLEVLAVREYRALYCGSLLSWLGDYLAKAAVSALVYHRTHSAALSAATFAISFVPWVVGGPVLAAVAERYSHRAVMIICDVVRAALVATVAIPGMPVPAMVALLFTASLCDPPFDAARSALLPRILEGDKYVVAIVIQNLTSQVAQLSGYVIGAGMAAYHPHAALFIDAGTFLVSAVLLTLFLGSHRPGLAPAQRTHLLRETGQGFRMLFGTDVLRAVAILIFALMLFPSVVEGLAAAWAGELSKTPAGTGLAQGTIMAGYPIGFIIGSVVIGRMLPPATRNRLIRPLAVLTPLSLAPALLNPPAPVVALLSMVCGFATSGLVPPVNGLFVRALPNAFRARAFGIMQSGVQIVQGGSIFVCGALASRFALHDVVGLWGLGGVLLMALASTFWPSARRFSSAFAAAATMNAADDETAADTAGKHAQPAAEAPRMPAAESV